MFNSSGVGQGLAAGASTGNPYAAAAGAIFGGFGGGGSGEEPSSASVSFRDFLAPINFGDYYGGSATNGGTPLTASQSLAGSPAASIVPFVVVGLLAAFLFRGFRGGRNG